ncbi:37S ribosomal protein S22 [Purpureocillium takamizusanense]|uniref:37S ribosomal protein S22 n=1 Tax=Purpureocillium takamizusanense TaxID=2060973 RepID=A0A9Q8Q4Y6_9HYPO|nr:37S ribosomal protein S22 [Purpureocillium takamizusanense]UNI13779.1 37S ribosomal protein S22 [Purpureocillium takamizusanense]
MLSFRGIRRACPVSSRHLHLLHPHTALPSRLLASGQVLRTSIAPRSFSTSSYRQDVSATPDAPSAQDVEKVVREAKQRFRDTLPKDYLNEQEYALYERLYGPPLRETRPEDVGIPTHADMGRASLRPKDEGVLLRSLEDGGFEEVTYEIDGPNNIADTDTMSTSEDPGDASLQGLTQRPPTYVEAVARNQRELDALQKLAQDFEVAQKKQNEKEEADGSTSQDLVEEQDSTWPIEAEHEGFHREPGEVRRFHKYTLDGRFHGSPIEISLPREEFVGPIRELLDRTHFRHVSKAAEDAFGGPGLPTSPSTPEGLRSGRMGGVGLPPDQRKMTEIEADAFLAGYLPPSYASVACILREVRKRVGGDWIQSRLKRDQEGGLSVLDAGAGGAGLVAWEQVLNAEWQLLKERGEVKGSHPPGKKTVIAASDRLRNRLKSFLHDTTFLPRLPDYEHSGEMRGKHLDAGPEPQPRKSFDVIIASHLFLKETQDHYRQAVLNNLWNLLSKDGGILIVIEKAHPRGFEAVAHVRDTILKQFLLPQTGEPTVAPEDFNPAFHRELEPGHIVAPCTTQGSCPMYQEQGKSKGRKDYCHFSQRFVRPTFYSKILGNMADNQGDVEFSYVVVRRGVPKSSPMTGKEATERAVQGYEASDARPDMQTLPRMVLPPLKRKGHVTLDLCTPEGQIERWTVPKSFSKLAYHDARKSRWGDLWALGAKTRVARKVRVGNGADEKPRKVEITMDGGRMSAVEKNASRARQPKSRAAKYKDVLGEIIAAEEKEERIIEQQMDEEVEAELDEREGRPRGRRRGGNNR